MREPPAFIALSPSRAPMTISVSHSKTARLASAPPYIPTMPKFSGWAYGRTESPIIVLTTGIPAVSAKLRNASRASESKTPPPTQISGFCAEFIAFTAFFIWKACPRRLGL